MSFYYHQNLEAFLQLLREQPQLFADSQRQELLELIEPLEDDVETLSNAIATWYEKDNKIVDAQLAILNRLVSRSEGDRIPGGLTGSVSPPPINQQLNKELLKNAILQSHPSAKKNQTQP